MPLQVPDPAARRALRKRLQLDRSPYAIRYMPSVLRMSSAIYRAMALLIVLLGLPSCTTHLESAKQEESRTAVMTIEQALNHHTEQLMSIPGVVGTAIGECDGRPCIMVLVVKKTPELIKKIPSTLDGFPVIVEETGTIRPLEKRKAKSHPAPMSHWPSPESACF